MRILEVIESKHWVNSKTGQTASIYGAVPYTNDINKNDWSIEIRGYTWRLDNGTVGLGRMPVKTKDEAIEIMNNFNNPVDYDPTPYCHCCGAKQEKNCDCGPTAENN